MKREQQQIEAVRANRDLPQANGDRLTANERATVEKYRRLAAQDRLLSTSEVRELLDLIDRIAPKPRT